MISIEVDDQVFAYLQDQAVPFVETPNLTLRRLFHIEKQTAVKPGVPAASVAASGVSQVRQTPRKKQPKANLLALVSSGYVREGQTLFLMDYQENRLQQYQAAVNGSSLKWKGQKYSMSDLAQELLKKEGYSSSSVRGPAHWCTESGETIKALWQQLQKAKSGSDLDP